ncbi:MAG: ferritin-like domain-containing protein [Acidobacteriia bacterium]|nr:ferritin-like domain-containing protein [Terriglobia bacterium]
MNESRFEDLYRQELQDIYDAEKQIVQALPRLIAAASTAELASAFEKHLQQTREQVKRLERVFEMMEEQPANRTCEGMQGLLKEGEKLISEMEKSPILDAGLIAAAQKVEHYEISAYGTLRTMAEMLGQPDAAELLNETLDEEKTTDENLTEIAESVLSGEAMADEADLDEHEELEDETEEEEITTE